MYRINDVFDYESDLTNPRKGGVEGALLDPSLHSATLWAAAVSTAPFLVFLVAVGHPLSWLVLALSMFAVYTYSASGLRFKERPVLDSVTSSTHFVSPALYGLVLAGATFTPQLWAILGAFFLWGLASMPSARCRMSSPTEREASPPSPPRSARPPRSGWRLPRMPLPACCSCSPGGPRCSPPHWPSRTS